MTRLCRDCGNKLDAKARGCPRCAWNIEAERALDRFVWWFLLPLIVLLVLAVATAIFLVRR